MQDKLESLLRLLAGCLDLKTFAIGKPELCLLHYASKG